MTGNKYCVIHGHFYQPPRESPWLDEIQRQPSAAPFHNWNERIFDECYRTNAYSRILDIEGKIVGVSNNYSYMSFNFGPTLFKWLVETHPSVYQRIVDADKKSCKEYNGHGSAVAQVYNHIIMPHASRRDKITQIKWAKSFFKRHFGRDPEGMWLAETAINMETAECLVEEGIKFTILSPNQAESFRFIGSDGEWINCDTNGLDSRHPYRLFIEDKDGKKSGKYLDIFFFDEPLSRAISFENLLDNADILSDRINGCYTYGSSEKELVTIATDGETFGHHKKSGDMCLAYFFRKKAEESGIKVVNLAYYLSITEPQREVRIKNAFGEGTAWSCAHGTGRWIRDCGCNTGGGPGWNQKWRTPLRDGMNYLQSEIDKVFFRELIKYFDDPWKIRDLYEPCFGENELGREFLKTYANRTIPENSYGYLLSLLEAQRYMLFGFTSCAWFFNDISGIETVQNYRYAVRAWQLTWQGQKSNDVLDKFVEIAAQAISNIPGITGKTILNDEVFPMLNHLEKAAFTAAVDNYIYKENVNYNLNKYSVELNKLSEKRVAEGDLLVFETNISHKISDERKSFVLSLYNIKGKNIEGVVFPLKTTTIVDELNNNYDSFVEKYGELILSPKDVFDEYREHLTEQFVDEFASDNLLDYLTWAGINSYRLDAITELNVGLPKELAGTVQFFLSKEWDIHINQLAKQKSFNGLTESLDDIDNRAKHYGITLNKDKSATVIENVIRKDIDKLLRNETNTELLESMIDKILLIRKYSIPVRFYQLQDRFYLFYKKAVREYYPNWIKHNKSKDTRYKELVKIKELAEIFGYNSDEIDLAN